MLDLIAKIQRRTDYLMRAIPKSKAIRPLSNAQRVDAIIELQRRAVSDPSAREKLERVTALINLGHSRRLALNPYNPYT